MLAPPQSSSNQQPPNLLIASPNIIRQVGNQAQPGGESLGVDGAVRRVEGGGWCWLTQYILGLMTNSAGERQPYSECTPLLYNYCTIYFPLGPNLVQLQPPQHCVGLMRNTPYLAVINLAQSSLSSFHLIGAIQP